MARNPWSLSPGGVVQAYVVIQNKGIGHSLIPELRDLYEAWVHFSVKDASGATIYESGFLESDGTLDPRAHSFINRPIDAAGNFIDNHMVWDEHAEGYDNTIQSGHSSLIGYQFRIPEHFESPLTITAAVDYRHFRQSYLNFVLARIIQPIRWLNLPREAEISSWANLPTKSLPVDDPEWMRWNNLGIALLDVQRFDDAEQAFERVVHLQPGYKHGYVNLALAFIQLEKLADARIQLAKALLLRPNDARATTTWH